MGRGLQVVEFPSIYIGRNEGLSKLRVIDFAKAGICIFEIAVRWHVTGFKPAVLEHSRQSSRPTHFSQSE